MPLLACVRACVPAAISLQLGYLLDLEGGCALLPLLFIPVLMVLGRAHHNNQPNGGGTDNNGTNKDGEHGRSGGDEEEEGEVGGSGRTYAFMASSVTGASGGVPSTSALQVN